MKLARLNQYYMVISHCPTTFPSTLPPRGPFILFFERDINLYFFPSSTRSSTTLDHVCVSFYDHGFVWGLALVVPCVRNVLICRFLPSRHCSQNPPFNISGAARNIYLKSFASRHFTLKCHENLLTKSSVWGKKEINNQGPNVVRYFNDSAANMLGEIIWVLIKCTA